VVACFYSIGSGICGDGILGLGFCFGDSNSGYLVYGLGFHGFGFCIRGVNVSGFEVLTWEFMSLEVFYSSGGIQGWERGKSNTG
jgi:hypothetical protein